MLFKLSCCIFLLLKFNTILNNQIEIDSKKAKEAPIKLFLGILGSSLYEIAENIKRAFEWTNQFTIEIQICNKPDCKNEIIKLEKNYSLAIYLEDNSKNNAVNWRLYDIIEGSLIRGKRINKNGHNIRDLSNKIADQLWFEITQQNSCFLSKIAYIKKNNKLDNNIKSTICICDYLGLNHEELNVQPGYYTGLSWDLNSDKKRLFCSELSKYNVKLVSILMNGKKQSIFNAKGTYTGLSLSADNNSAVYCKSGSIWKYEFKPNISKASHSRIIQNEGKNFRPTLLPNNDIIFCSDSKGISKENKLTNGPKICYYNYLDKSITVITKNGYCLSPAYCFSTKQIAYIKKVNNFFQLFTYDTIKKRHKQLTKDNTNKLDPNWSPCGNFIVYCVKDKSSSKIAVININNNNYSVITDDNAWYSSPTWA